MVFIRQLLITIMFDAKIIAICLYGKPECIFPFEAGKLSFSLPYSTKLYNYFRAVHTLNSVFMLG